MFLQIFLFALYATEIKSARILAAFPVPSVSHQVVFRPFTQELAQRGHEVTVITPNLAFPNGGAPENLTEIDVHDLSYKIWGKYLKKLFHKGLFNEFDWIELLRFFSEIFLKQIQSDNVKEILKNKKFKFDLLILEACVPISLVFSHLYKVPVIQVSSAGAVFDTYKIIGAVEHYSLFPEIHRKKLFNLSLWDEIQELHTDHTITNIVQHIENYNNARIKETFGADVPNLKELKDNIAMSFINENFLWGFKRPVPLGINRIYGIHQAKPKEISQELKKYLDSSKNGVIYFSLGSNINTSILSPKKIQMILNVFKKLPYNVMMKWDKDELQRPSNVKIFKWVPQPGILRHQNIKLFITQGGLQSTEEAIQCGVPMVGIPISVDQFYNVEHFVYFKIGVKLDIKSLNERELKEAIETVLSDESYRKNVAILRDLMYDQPQSPLERAVWWTEHVLRHEGARHLRAPAANMPWTQYYELELVAYVLASVVLLVVVNVLAINFACKYISVKIRR